MDIRSALSLLDHNSYWLDQYVSFLEDAPEPGSLFDRHHILPQALYPEFKSFHTNKWNKIDLHPSDHLLAHYYLYRALPTISAVRAAFIMMVGLRYAELIEQNYNLDLVKDIANAYEEARSLGVDSTIKGWVRIYRTDDECSICPSDQVDSYVSLGWKVGVPKRTWVRKGTEEHKVLMSEVPAYIQQGFTLGRNEFLTEASKKLMSISSVKKHKIEAEKEDAYSYLPSGDNHHRRILGCPPEVAEKISKTLKGRPKPASHPVHQGLTKGLTWEWSDTAKQARSESMQGIVPTNGLTMKGKSHTPKTRRKMSKAHEEFFSNPDKVRLLDAARPRGEDHVFYGKERDAETRQKIAQSLTGKTQSEDTKKKRAASLAKAKMPAYTQEENEILIKLSSMRDEKKFALLAKQLKGYSAKIVAAGLKIMKFRTADGTNYRHWRQAATWKANVLDAATL